MFQNTVKDCVSREKRERREEEMRNKVIDWLADTSSGGQTDKNVSISLTDIVSLVDLSISHDYNSNFKLCVTPET